MLIHVSFFGFSDSQPAVALHPEVGSVNVTISRWLIVIGILGTHLFADSHTAATYMRVYANAESRSRFRIYAFYLPYVSLVLFLLALNIPYVAGTVVYVHMMWVYQHYASQSFGMALIYCYKRGYMFSKIEREIFRYMMLALASYVITRILCLPAFSPLDFFGVTLPFWGVPKIFHYLSCFLFIALTLAFIIIVIRKFINERKVIPVPSLMIVLSVAAIGMSTGYANSLFWLYGAPFFHGSQYCAVSLAYHLKEKGMPEGLDPRRIASMFLTPTAFKWFGLVFLSGCFIYVGIPHFLESFGFNFVIVATTIQACINFHHFVTDAAIWRLRDPKCRQILLA